MVIGIFGESCVGKSTLAELLKEKIDGEIYSGKDSFDFACDEISGAIA